MRVFLMNQGSCLRNRFGPSKKNYIVDLNPGENESTDRNGHGSRTLLNVLGAQRFGVFLLKEELGKPQVAIRDIAFPLIQNTENRMPFTLRSFNF